MRVIGISGKIGSGKTSVAEYLSAKHGFVVDRIATSIKIAVAEMTRTTLDDNMKRKDIVARGEYSDGEVCVMSLGQHQVLYGKKEREKHGDDIFVRRLWARLLEKMENVIIDDVRLQCEADFLVSKGIVLLRIERSEAARAPYLCGRDQTDITEVDLDEFEFKHVLYNDGSERDLFANVVRVVGADF